MSTKFIPSFTLFIGKIPSKYTLFCLEISTKNMHQKLLCWKISTQILLCSKVSTITCFIELLPPNLALLQNFHKHLLCSKNFQKIKLFNVHKKMNFVKISTINSFLGKFPQKFALLEKFPFAIMENFLQNFDLLGNVNRNSLI